ncbi:MAG: hypothetical protein COW00_12110 [Bdellovibrio sp. CG12_big_fil_rev_8_21_14_0_65_39_13]|nr:MAG: hypothetical protein COW78_15180 [Bdellovibrio sp. CG22_combo_CG10-13_8_21_14_all_39_27]PIQ59122.1 MAG: hypothetical protein COW00_12110 [Bdellovibrio sp. CG12_big_fil_rev_8_21_14_0_65_39_13]PIR33689.1 MAG: hypothetical protein COV37_15505 [Bdellovibrio sp. CG11_big_fil_rev_8_21_14_0_20_39_38]PJB53307.1 MAG: hypothetical protein CO099_07850 [Bdellovibrio sp. CG_4_9_14_3_um_filter_39_7]
MNALKRILLLLPLLFVSCSGNQTKQIEIEKREVRDVHTKDDMVNRTREILEKSGLSADQKEKFLELHGQMIFKMNQMNEEFHKLKILLFKEMTKKKRNRSKINEITRQIKKLHNEKLTIMLGSLEKVDKILGDKSMSIYQEDWFLEHIKP